MRDSLFLLRPGFADPKLGPDRYYCVECAALEGLLTFDTRLAGRLDVQRIEFERPRPALVALLGTEHQNCPTLVLAQPPEPGAPGVQMSNSTGRAFVTGLVPIGEYLAFAHRVARPHP